MYFNPSAFRVIRALIFGGASSELEEILAEGAGQTDLEIGRIHRQNNEETDIHIGRQIAAYTERNANSCSSLDKEIVRKTCRKARKKQIDTQTDLHAARQLVYVTGRQSQKDRQNVDGTYGQRDGKYTAGRQMTGQPMDDRNYRRLYRKTDMR